MISGCFSYKKHKSLSVIGIIFGFIGLAETAISLSTLLPQTSKELSNNEYAFVLVTKVIDGDTFQIETGEKVRLLGINAPEVGEKCYEEAKKRLKELIEGKKVKLERDVKDKDQYGRLLRYVFVDDSFVNLMLVKEGLAHTYIVKPNVKYANELKEAENYAESNHIGCLWKKSSEKCEDCIKIHLFHYDAEGNDCYNLNDEYVVFINTCEVECDITGWTVKDEGSHKYTFPNLTLQPKETVTLYTGCGENKKNELYWCNSGYTCNAIWDNDGDTLYLFDSEGNFVLSYSY